MFESNAVISVVMPLYNEEAMVADTVSDVLARAETFELIIVDDFSTDKSYEIVSKLAEADKRIKLFKNEANRGKGYSVRKGIEACSGKIILVQDADREYSPSDYPMLIDPILSGKADVVYGSRFLGGQGRVLYFRHELGNRLLTFISNLLTDINLTDMETCYKAFRREVIQNINLESDRFGFEVEVTAKIAKARHLRIYEVPITYNGRTYEEGKKITWKDGIAALWHMIRFNLLTCSAESFKKNWKELEIKE
jgi:glycosyltransferase involved in cell wall biosynthesis